MAFVLRVSRTRTCALVALLLILQILPSRGGTLVVNVDPADDLTFDDGDGFFYQPKPCAFNSVFPGCWVFDIIDTPCGIRCVEFSYYLEPTSDQSTYTYTTPERTCRECYCGAEFDAQDSFVSFRYTPTGATLPYTGGFRIMSSSSAGTSAMITCTPDAAGFQVNCEDATLNWDPRCDQSVSVTISIAGQRRDLELDGLQETELAIEKRHDQPALERDVDVLDVTYNTTMTAVEASLNTNMPSSAASFAGSEAPTAVPTIDTPQPSSQHRSTTSSVTAAPTIDESV